MIEFRSYASSSRGNLHEITDGQTSIMIDMGLPWPEIQKHFGFETSRLAGACITHSHGDHSASVRLALRSGLDCYMLPETAAALGVRSHRLHPIAPLHPFMVGTFTIKAFPLEHDVPNCGFLFCNREGEKAVYITDSAYCRYKFRAGLQVIAIECNYSKNTINPNLDIAVRNRLYSTHMSLETVKGFLQANDLSEVRSIHLLHLSDQNSDAEMFKREIMQATGKPVYVAGE